MLQDKTNKNLKEILPPHKNTLFSIAKYISWSS